MVYLTILDKNPNIFLPSLLAVSPRICSEPTFDVQSHCDSYQHLPQIVLHDAVKLIFDEIACATGISMTETYQKIVEVLLQRNRGLLRLLYLNRANNEQRCRRPPPPKVMKFLHSD
jgi:hypothetical protein